jgi:predicted cupin superfamily sugar epimerase
MTADAWIERLRLEPHPEGGHFKETWRDVSAAGGRGAGSAIYFLLRAGEISRWHRVDAVEIWHFYAGAPLELRVSTDGTTTSSQVLGANLAAGERPQLIVPAHAWQSARSLGDFTLVGCTVSPAFEFERFELAAPGWEPGGGATRPRAGET